MRECQYYAADIGRDFNVDLISLQLRDGFPGGDHVTLFFEPAQNGGFSHGLSHLRDADFNGHELSYSFSTLRRFDLV